MPAKIPPLAATPFTIHWAKAGKTLAAPTLALILTDMGIESNEKAKELALHDSLVKSFSDPNNVAEFICYLSETKGITGQVFNLDSRIL